MPAQRDIVAVGLGEGRGPGQRLVDVGVAEHGAAVGRDVSEIEISVEIRERSMAQADELHAAGATLFTYGFEGPTFDMGPVREWLSWRDDHR